MILCHVWLLSDILSKSFGIISMCENNVRKVVEFVNGFVTRLPYYNYRENAYFKKEIRYEKRFCLLMERLGEIITLFQKENFIRTLMLKFAVKLFEKLRRSRNSSIKVLS